MKKLEVDKDYSSEKIWSFDLGIASIGYAIRGYNEDSPIDFQEVKSLIIPAEFASIKDQSIRRRAFRTRSAHKAREEYLISFFEKLRLPVLKGRRVAKIEGKWQLVSLGDNYLEREFPAPGENTVYNSALLRIQLIEGVPMAPWQIFKAFYSAIQKRGYDSKVPWRTSYKNDDNNENSKTTQKANAMEQFIQATFAQDKQYPCYWEAWRMKLWTPEEGIVSLRINHHAQNIKEESSQCNESSPPLPAIYPCNLVENELRALYKEAEKQLPALKGKVNEFLFGIGEKRYASYLAQHCDKELRQELLNKGIKLIPGKETDRQGVLSQKIPTFDNRCPENCKLIPRFHVAKRAAKIVQEQLLESSLLPAELSFLMQLKNIRFRMIEDKEGFNAEEIRAIFQEVRSAALLKNDPEKIVKTFKLTHKELNTYAKKLRRITLEKSMEIVAPSTSGRSRFSKPALLLLKEIILSGKSPEEFRQYLEEEGTILARYRLSLNDISIFSSERMGETWEQLYIPDASLSESLNCLGQDKSTRMKAIQALIGKQLDPIIRDRLFRIVRLISSLEERFGTPDRIVLEFVRDDFLGAKAKMKLAQRQRDNYRRNMKNLTKSRGDFKLAFKHKLWKEQGGICPFTGKPISLDEIQNDGVHIDHIVPRAMGGPNAHYNYALTHSATNIEKGKKTPYQWLRNSGNWDAYVARVNERSSAYGIKKLALLVREDAADCVERYQALAETAWIAKLAHTIFCLYFGWKSNFENSTRKIVIINGGLTNKIARNNGLYNLLGEEKERVNLFAIISSSDADTKARSDAYNKLEKKNRDDKRHHALDAMVLSFIPAWSVDKTKRHYYRLPQLLLNQGGACA